MRRTTAHLLAVALVAALLPAFAAPAVPNVEEPAEASRWFVLLTDPPLARYEGGVAGIPATAAYVTGASRLDPHTVESRAYLAYLAARHDAVVTAASAVLGRQVEPLARYDAVLNGVALELTREEASVVASLPGVRDVEPDQRLELHTDAGPEWIGADAFWTETPEGLEGLTGEGVVVGIIDTGVNPFHPSFAAVGPVDGHVHTNPTGTYFGFCDPITGLPFCNDKLIGMYDFTGSSPVDDHGHGSHVASTVAGNLVDAALESPTATVEARIAGVAPHANIISYKACNTGSCLGTIAVDILNQVVFDPVDVVNYSIGGSPANPWTNAGAQAFLDLTAAGIFVATSAGNNGPGPGTVGTPANAPWITTVGASTHQRAFLNSLVDITGGEGVPSEIDGKSISGGHGPARVVYAGDFGDPLCGAPFPPGTWDGEIVLCDRGINARVEKAQNVGIGGAGGYILANDEPSGEELIADPYPIPGVHVTYADGVLLKDWIAAGGGADHDGTATITGTNLDVDTAHGDVMAAFSSRGPNSPVPSVLKPDITAPGVDILAAWVPHGDVADYNVISGTSMSSPHTAGAAALVRALHPDWSPDAVRSALMTTAFTEPPGTGQETQPVLDDDGTTPATPFAQGAGRVDLRAAINAGLVIEETIAGYVAANPANEDGDPSALNIPSIAHDDCATTCTWTRTVTSVASTAVTWATAATGAPRMGITVEPASFTIEPGATQEITVTVDATHLRPAAWHFGEVTLAPDSGSVSSVRLPVAVGTPAGEGAQILDLHFHGNVKDGCSGLGVVDVETNECDGPYLRTDTELDSAPAAAFGPLTAVRGGTERNGQDAGWTWYLDEPVTVGGPMTAEFWASCLTCEAPYTSEWRLTIWADGARVHNAGPFPGGLPGPGLTGHVTIETTIPAVTAARTLTVQINPWYDDMVGAFIYYDSTAPCPLSASTDPCDSLVRLPVIAGPDLTVASLEVRPTSAQERTGPHDRARVVAQVANLGTADAPASRTELRLLGPGGEVLRQTVATPAIAAGETVTVSIPLDTRGLRGDYTVRVEANAAWDFWELDTTNTVATLAVRIQGTTVTPR